MGREFYKRIPTAIVLLSLTFVTIQYFPVWAYFCVVQILIIAALWEFYTLVWRKKHVLEKLLGVIIALLISSTYILNFITLELALFSSIVLMAFYFILSINKKEKLSQFPSIIAVTFFGAFYLSFTLNYFNFLREDFGPFMVYFLLTVIFIGDTGAYIIGKMIGKYKMVPIASPNKTWEGCLGGIIFAGLSGLAMHWIFLSESTNIWRALILALIVHAVAQVSDPFESLFKRAVGVKDSSNLLPGHGGFLDRSDSLILAGPLFYFLLKYFGIQ